MSVIFFSMSGEGRGHATRARTLVEYLKREHRIVLFAPSDAYAFLAPLYFQDPAVEIREIPGVVFHYKEKKLDLTKTLMEGLLYFRKSLYTAVDHLAEQIEREKPDLCITDWEPSLPRAALRCDTPFISLSHQHFLESYNLSSLPMSLRYHAWMMNWVVKTHYSGQVKTIVTGFFSPPLKPGYEDVCQIGPVIRPEICQATITEGDHYVSYLRKATSERVVHELEKTGLPIRIYGLGNRPALGNLTFHPIDPHRFVEDLSSCKAVFCAAGNQLLGECLYLGKPVLGMPEKSHYEQLINSHFLRQMGCGDFVLLEDVVAQDISRFLTRIHEFRIQLQQTRHKLDGTPKMLEIVRDLLPQSTGPVATKPVSEPTTFSSWNNLSAADKVRLANK
jgi:uncharacterized protein (TIGR00661 family)